MHIVFAASECVPFIKTGGLADVIGALPAELVRQGQQVTVYLPLFRQVQAYLDAHQSLEQQLRGSKIAIRSLTLPFPSYNRFVSILDGGQREGVQFYFVDCPELFDRESPYGPPGADYADNWERFGLFARAVLEASKQLGVPDVFHLHDWQAALAAVYLRTTYARDPVLERAATMLTIHNAGFQGFFPPQTTERLLLPWELFAWNRLEHYGTFNFLKGGLVYADVLTTVSRSYAAEIQTPEFGNSLEGVLQERSGDLHGILNGVDYQRWDPEHDGCIAAHYTRDHLEGKALCRRDLLHAFGSLPTPDATPVLGIVSHFATRKGFDLIAEIAPQLAERDLRLLALGTGEPYYENLFRSLEERYPGRFGVRVTYDNTLAHKIEAGADIFLMPSRYEPCGLNQIYSLRYGTVPVVRATGGLNDTVEEWNGEQQTGTGFKFSGYAASDFLAAIDRALTLFADRQRWLTLMRNGMQKEYSWQQPASQYIALYEEVVRRRS
ncbi:MAG TPA: glycogen synthase GlgA [Acidobacteriaceae bacterium]